jgi:hypothetical protein
VEDGADGHLPFFISHFFLLMKRFISAALLMNGMLVLVPAHAQWQAHASAGIRQVRMTEVDRSGRQLVEERGSLPGLEAGISYLAAGWSVDFSGETYGSSIAYDGRTQAGTPFASETGTTQSRVKLEALRQLSQALSLVGALEWDYWRRNIAGHGATLGLAENYATWRFLGGAQISMPPSRLGIMSVKTLLILCAPEQQEVRFALNTFDATTLRTAQGAGARLSLALARVANSGMDLQLDFEWLRVPRSDDVPLRRNGVEVGSLAQPEHVRSSLGIKATYRF